MCVCFNWFFLQLNYKAKYEETKFKSSLPPDYPFFIQSRVNAFNLSEVSNCKVICISLLIYTCNYI